MPAFVGLVTRVRSNVLLKMGELGELALTYFTPERRERRGLTLDFDGSLAETQLEKLKGVGGPLSSLKLS